LYDEYEKLMLEKGLIDFDDQEILAFRMFEKDPEYLKEHFRFEHIIVDEYQDTSQGQVELLKLLRTLPTFKSLMVVGDD
ncbi:MAG TPA: ATP-dependent DNA helicase PcrA, partial [Sarcina sp.]|nr:ATP-dependent DNA helicase PcrA [Sarcina sp.]